MITPQSKRIVILFSSGFDSTLLLAEAVAKADPDTIVSAVAVENSLTIKHQLKREHENQLLIIRALRKKYPDRKIEYDRIQITADWQIGFRGNAQGCLVQPLLWFSAIFNLLPMLKAGDCVQIGYNKNDKALAYKDTIYNLWQNALAMQNNKDIALQMPLLNLDKPAIIEKILVEYSYLIEYITSCEGRYTTQDKPCRQCEPCNHLIQALLDLGLSTDKYISTTALALLKERFDIEAVIAEENK